MKAVALLSGGLDSTLAIKVILDQGIEVTALNFRSPFCRCNRLKGCSFIAKKVADEFKIDIKAFYLGQEYLEIVKKPNHGYGKNLNPCIDCRIMMLNRAREFMKEIGAEFVITGEVLGQRPKSQKRFALKIVERESGLEGLVVRPLSAKLLSPTIPEQKGWINRKKLLSLSGRARSPQIRLASKAGITDYPCAAGGCLLTERSFCGRIKDLIDYEKLNIEEIELLKVGRHFRLTPSFKLVVGRNEEENSRLLNVIQKDDLQFEPLEVTGPIAVGRGEWKEEVKYLSSQIIARYCDHGLEKIKESGKANPVRNRVPNVSGISNGVKVGVKMFPDGSQETFEVLPLGESQLKIFRI